MRDYFFGQRVNELMGYLKAERGFKGDIYEAAREWAYQEIPDSCGGLPGILIDHDPENWIQSGFYTFELAQARVFKGF